MTTTVFQSSYQNTYAPTHHRRNSSQFSQLIYHVTVTDEDNESITYEIMADSCSEACAEAENLASYDMINIAYIDVEVMG